MVVLLMLVGALLLGRSVWPSAPLPPGELIEVRGDVPRPGIYRVEPPTVSAAVAAAGGGEVEAPAGRLRAGDRVEVTGTTATVREPTDPLLVALPVDINTADAHTLTAIPGVGQSTADAIVESRRRRGHFATVADLGRVDGLGPTSVDALAPFVTALPEGPPLPPVPLNPNQASASALERLPGIGPVVASRIVVDREEQGPYQHLEDLARVKGVGPVTLDRIRPYVEVR
jgi:competence protein ComEA